MQPEQPWLGIETGLDDLSRDAAPPVRAGAEKLQMAAAATPPKFPPEMVELLAGLLRETDKRVRAGTPTDEAARAVADKAATYDQPGWNVEQVFNVLLSTPERQTPAAPAPKPLDVVLVVMTRAEAEELIEGHAFTNYPAALREDFLKLCTILRDASVEDWAGRYHDEPRAWRPFGPANPSLEELVTKTIERLNELQGFKPAIVPRFTNISNVNDDRWKLRRLRHEGCVVILDSLSMRHPKLQRAFHQSLLDAYPTTSVVAMAPVMRAFEEARELAVILELRLADLEFAKRRVDPDEESGLSFETTERNLLEQWLSTRVKAMAGSMGVKTGIRSYMRIAPAAEGN
jgi:hypothetical protein